MILLFILLIALVVVIALNTNKDGFVNNGSFQLVSSSPSYPISYIQGVRIGRKIFDPTYHDPALSRLPKQYLGPIE